MCATLTVPLAILQESFLSFLGLGVPPPLASWGTLASDAIAALNPVRVYWWLLAFAVRDAGGDAAGPELRGRRPPRRLRPAVEMILCLRRRQSGHGQKLIIRR